MIRDSQILLVFAMSFLCCGQLELDLEVDTPKVIATNFLLQNGNNWELTVTKLRGISDSLFYEEIPEPLINISYDNSNYDNFSIIKVSPNIIPKYGLNGQIPAIPNGSICELTISSLGFPTITSTDTMPAPLDIISVEIIEQKVNKFSNPLLSNHFDVSGILKMKINREQGNNFILPQLELENDLYDPNPGVITEGQPKTYLDSTYISTGTFSYEGLPSNLQALDLNTFSNVEPTLYIKFFGRFLSTDGTTKIKMDFLTLSQTYYNYLIESNRILVNNADVFSEITSTEFNIHDGYGIFALANKVTLEFEVN